MDSQKKRQGFWQNTQSLLILMILLTHAGIARAAEDLPTGEAQEVRTDSQNSDEYNFNWLDPDKKVYVLQNRKYLKGGHPVITAMGGTGFSNPYRQTLNVDGRLDYYINELFGIEAFYTYTFNYTNSTITALNIAAPNTLPSVTEIRSQMGGMIHFVPWYAKLNMFNMILYFDWYFGAGVGAINAYTDTRTQVSAASNYVQQNLIGYYFSTGHIYHLSQSFLVRLDFTGSIYQNYINGTAGTMTWFNNLNIAMGFGWRI